MYHTKAAAPPAPSNPLVPAPAQSGFDGRDDWGRGSMNLGDIAGRAVPSTRCCPMARRCPPRP
eukprot:6962817-Prymnesium_polylepis.1